MHVAKTRLEDYLTTIYRLEEAFGVAKITDIAYELGVSPATVSKVVKRLETENLVVREKYHFVALNERGKTVAEAIIKKHRIAEFFLSRVLGFNDYESHYYAHLFEHLPDVVIEKLHGFLGFPVKCPHGNPLPGYSVPEKTNLRRLSAAREGEKCIVERLLGELRDVLEFATKAAVRVGLTLTVLSKGVDSVKASLGDGEHITIPMRIANLVLVECSG